MQLLKKISARTVVGTKEIIKALCPEDGSMVVIMRLGGSVTGTKTDESAFGQWTSLSGSFKAYNAVTGEEFRGRNAFVPDEFLGEVLGALEAGAETVDFVLDVGVKATDTAVGYEYIAIPKTEAIGNDPLETLFGSVEPMVTLEAPKAKAKAKPKAKAKV